MRPTLLILVVGCSSITNHPTFDEIKLTPLAVSVSTLPPLVNGIAARDSVLRITMDDYPDPDSLATFGLVLLRSGPDTFDATTHVSLLDRAIDVTPRSLLAADTHYELVIGAELRALSGRTVGSTLAADISVGETVSSPSPSPSPLPIWDTTIDCPSPGNVRCDLQTCAPACHAPEGCSNNTRNPTSALDLTGDPSDPTLGLIGVASVLLAGSDDTLVRVQPFDSAHSVLVRKLLGGNPHAESSDPPTANLGVPGRRMPLDEVVCAGQGAPSYWTEDQIRLVQDWIDQGAVVK